MKAYFSLNSDLSHVLNLLGKIAFLQTIYMPNFGSNGPLWSLANEFWYYVLFPFMVVAFLCRNRVTAMVPTVLMIPVVMILPTAILKYFAVWLLGAAVWAIRAPLANKSVAWFLFLVIFLMSGFSFTQIQFVGFAFDLLIALSLVLLINTYRFSMDEPGEWYHALQVRLFADFSYSLYLVHFPLLVLLSTVMLANEWHLSISAQGLLLFPVIAIAIYIMAYLFARVTELNTLQLKAWVHERLSARRSRTTEKASPIKEQA